MTEQDILEFDVLIIGAGPAGLSAAIHLKQLAQQQNLELSVCVLDKGSEVGAHIISGCMFNPRALNELIPNWRELNFPLTTPVKQEKLLYLSKKHSFKLPIPLDWQNDGNFLISLSQLCRRLAQYAEELGVEIYPGFAAKEVIIEQQQVVGISTCPMGLNKDGTPGHAYQAGVIIRAKQTILAEGCRGSVSKQVIAQFKLNQNSQPQSYGLGIKEIWRISSQKHQSGLAIHSLGYPLDRQTYGGGFLYHLNDNLIAVGFVIGLDYANPYLNPYEEFQRFKQHPQIRATLLNGERLEYGARSVIEGGLLSLPQLCFAGGILIGDSAGFLNVAKVKGVDNAMKSGMLGAKAIITALQQQQATATTYPQLFKQSWLYQDLYSVRNIRPAFQYGRLFGLFYTAFEKFIWRNSLPFTLKIKQHDHQRLEHKAKFSPITYPPYDNQISFDKASSLHLANLTHEGEQPIHLRLTNPSLALKVNLIEYAAVETSYCPAGVYEIVKQNDQPNLHINAQNCLHCKACDIKDPRQNITWHTPEGGSGPQYSDM